MSLIGITLLSYLGIGMLIGFIWVHYDDFSYCKDPEEAKGNIIISMTFLWGYVLIALIYMFIRNNHKNNEE